MDDVGPDDERARKERSPSFPFIPLDRAIERARTMATSHRKNPTRLATVAETWGYSPASSGLQQTAAALKAFGLLEDMGRGGERRVQLTELAWRILTDARPGAKEQAIQEAAVKPRLIAEYAQTWVPERPSDSHCLSELELDRGFTPVAAKLFLRTFDETISFANLGASDKVSDYSQPSEPSEKGGSALLRLHTAQLAQLREHERASFTMQNEARQTPVRMAGGTTPRATLPLPEGIVALELPPRLSKRSHDAVKAWVGLMVQLAEADIRDDPAPSENNA